MRAIVVVIDGLGVGAINPTQPHNTMRSIREASITGRFFLDELAGGDLLQPSDSTLHGIPVSCRHITPTTAEPDTFGAHREMIAATDYTRPATLAESASSLRAALDASPHQTLAVDGLLVIDQCVTIADNLDTAPGLSLLVLADDTVAEPHLASIVAIARAAVDVPRLNIHTGPGAAPPDIAAFAITKTINDRDVCGVHVGHLDPTGQRLTAAYACAPLRPPHLLTWLTDHHHSVSLIGKAPDLFPDTAPHVEKHRSINLNETGGLLIDKMLHQTEGLIFVNYPHIDIAGHRQDPAMAARHLTHIELQLGHVTAGLHKDDLFIILADHGNDPRSGPRHTREHVPLITIGKTYRPNPLPPGLTIVNHLVKQHQHLNRPRT